MLLMIDNYDSFTWNLVQYFSELGQEVAVHRNDQITLNDIEAMKPQRIALSPGPCTPNEAGISMAVIKHFKGKIPLFGVCLGYQSIGQVFGGNIIRARQVMHGKISLVYHNGDGIFAGLPNPVAVTRYHSLVVEKETLPSCFEVTSWTQNDDGSMDEIMGLRHKKLPIEGVQFHPESIMTESGHEMLNNFLKMTC